MNSRGWGLGQTRGDGSLAGAGSAGEQPAPDRNGSARVVIGFAALWLAVVSGACWVMFSRQADGLLLLTTMFVVALFWVAGVFTKAFWRR